MHRRPLHLAVYSSEGHSSEPCRRPALLMSQRSTRTNATRRCLFLHAGWGKEDSSFTTSSLQSDEASHQINFSQLHTTPSNGPAYGNPGPLQRASSSVPSCRVSTCATTNGMCRHGKTQVVEPGPLWVARAVSECLASLSFHTDY